MSGTLKWGRILVGAALAILATCAQADPVQLIVQSSDPMVSVGGFGGGRFRALLGNMPVYVYCVDFAHTFQYGHSYWVDVTPLTGDLAAETRYGAVPLYGWNYANGQYTALQRYMMASWLITQYAPYFADWSSSVNRYQAQGIQSAIWTLLEPRGAPTAPNGGNRNYWLQAVTTAIQQPDHDDPADSFYRYFRIVSPAGPTALRPQEFIVVVTPEPASLLMLGGVLGLLGVGILVRRREGARSKTA